MKYISSFIFLSVLSLTSHGAATVCSGQVERIGFSPSEGSLYLDIGHGVFKFCSFRTAEQNVDPEACKAMYASFLSAQAKGKPVDLYLNEGISCSVLSGWGYPSPYPYYVNFYK